MSETHVRRYPVEPRRKFALHLESAKPLIDAKEDFLVNILGVIRIPDEPGSNGQDFLVVAKNQLLKGREVALLGFEN
jgi:hypothetical protein